MKEMYIIFGLASMVVGGIIFAGNYRWMGGPLVDILAEKYLSEKGNRVYQISTGSIGILVGLYFIVRGFFGPNDLSLWLPF